MGGVVVRDGAESNAGGVPSLIMGGHNRSQCFVPQAKCLETSSRVAIGRRPKRGHRERRSGGKDGRVGKQVMRKEGGANRG